MNRLLGSIGSLALYLSLGTVIAQCAALGYLWTTGYLSPLKLREIDAVMRDFRPPEARNVAKTGLAPVIPSSEEVARARALAQRDLELREQSLRHRAELVKAESAKLAEQIARYNQIKAGLERELAQLSAAATGDSAEQVRTTLENLKPRQAKDQLLRMINDDDVDAAVQLLGAMSVAKRAKVCSEFKTEEEAKQLADILKRIREGEPELKVIDAAKENMQAGS